MNPGIAWISTSLASTVEARSRHVGNALLDFVISTFKCLVFSEPIYYLMVACCGGWLAQIVCFRPNSMKHFYRLDQKAA
jgi:hypothetical protein